MENNHDQIKLTSSEIAALWGSYMNDTLAICTISYFLKDVKDPDIRSVLEYALEFAKKHIQFITVIFNKEKFPIPVGFTEHDVNLEAPRLFPDLFMLYYIQSMGAMGLNGYSVALPNSARKDIREFYSSCLSSSTELYNSSSDVMQAKGVFIRSPYIPYEAQAEFIEKNHFLAGWLGKQRPLTTIEMSYLFFNLYRNTMGAGLLTGFSQVANSKKVRLYMVRGAEIAKHHVAVFSNFFIEDNILVPMTSEMMPLTSTIAPFSDRLMMYHTVSLNTIGIGYYGTSLGASARKDVSAAYIRLLVEVGEFSEDGANLMIDNGWLEKPPSAPDRRDLAKG